MPDRPFFDPTPEAVQRFVRSVPLYARDDDPAFWPDERFVERRDALLRRQLGWIAAGSPHYQKRFAELGLEPGDIRTVADLRQLPVTTKQDLMEDSSAFRLELPDRGVYDTTYFTLRTTGTTSGRPTTYEYTTHDYFGWLLSTRRLYKMHCFLPGELHFAAYPVSPMPHVSSIQAALCAGGGGAFYAGLGGAPYGEFAIHNSTEYVIDEIVRLRPQILSGVGSFLRRLLRDAAEQGRDLSTLVALTPAAEVFTAAMLEEVRANAARCGAARPIIAAPYSFTEAGLSWGQGYEGARLQCTSPDQVYLEVLDEDTLAPVADGQPGLLAVTHLNRRGMPLLRRAAPTSPGAVTSARSRARS